MKNKHLTIVLLLVVAVGLLPATSPPATAQAAPILVWIGDNYELNPAVFEEFEHNTGIEVAVEMYPWGELNALFSEAVADGRGPDVVYFSEEWVYHVLEEGWLMPVMPDVWTEQMLPFAVQAFTHDGQLFGVPIAIESLALVRNTDLVPEPPPTWDAVAGISLDVRVSGAAKYGFVLPDGDVYHLFPILSAFGGYVFGQNEDGSWNRNDIGLNNDGSVAAVAWLAETAINDILQTGLDWETAHNEFYARNAAMIITGPWVIGQLRESGVPFAVSALPSQNQPARPFVHVHGFLISANCKDPDAAQALLKHIASARSMRLLQDGFDRLSTHVATIEQLEDPALLGFLSSALNGQRYPDPAILDAIWDPLREAVQMAREGARSPADAMQTAVAQIREALGLE